MMMLLTAAILIVLLVITYDDLQQRSVRVFLFPLLAIGIFSLRLESAASMSILVDAGINLVYIIMISALAWAYIKFRYRTHRLAQFIGLGDLLLILCVSIWFEPVQFIIFNTVSLIIALILHVMLRSLLARYRRFDTVPLAGFQSCCFAVVVIMGSIQ